MGVVVGPVLTRPGGYAFDIWTVEDGISHGYVYRRLEDARYARDAAIERAMAESALIDGSEPLAAVCARDTLEQFISALVERGALITDGVLRALGSRHVA